MRVAVLILGLVLGAIMFLQALVIAGLSGVTDDDETGAAAAVGLLMALLWLVACALVIPAPRVSLTLFVLAGVLGFAVSADYPDLAVWGGASLVLAFLSFLGWRGKRRADLKEKARDEMLAEAVAARRAAPPPS